MDEWIDLSNSADSFVDIESELNNLLIRFNLLPNIQESTEKRREVRDILKSILSNAQYENRYSVLKNVIFALKNTSLTQSERIDLITRITKIWCISPKCRHWANLEVRGMLVLLNDCNPEMFTPDFLVSLFWKN